MKVIFRNSSHLVARFDRGEELVSELKKLARTQQIPAATFTGIGACQKVELAFYELANKTYARRLFEEDLEMVSLIGNISWQEDRPIIHGHGSFSRRDYSLIGGHVFLAEIAATAEVSLELLAGQITRKKDEATELSLLEKWLSKNF